MKYTDVKNYKPQVYANVLTIDQQSKLEDIRKQWSQEDKVLRKEHFAKKNIKIY